MILAFKDSWEFVKIFKTEKYFSKFGEKLRDFTVSFSKFLLIFFKLEIQWMFFEFEF